MLVIKCISLFINVLLQVCPNGPFSGSFMQIVLIEAIQGNEEKKLQVAETTVKYLQFTMQDSIGLALENTLVVLWKESIDRTSYILF